MIKTKKVVYITNLSNYSVMNILDPLIKFDDFSEKEKYQPKKGDKIYILPESSVPRFKLKNFCEKYSVSLVKYKDSANIVIGCQKSLSIHFAPNAMNVINRTYDKNAILNRSGISNDLIEAVKESDVEFVLVNGGNNSLADKNKIDGVHYITTISNEGVDKLNNILYNNIDYKIFNENDILTSLNDGAVMTRDMYESIQRMLESKDSKDLTVAMETMANCDYKSSCVYLLCLLSKFKSKIYDSKTKHHINFKTLLKFFDINLNYSLGTIDIIDSLIKVNYLNINNLNLLYELMEDKPSKNNYYTYDNLIFSEEMEKALDANVIDVDCNTEIIYDKPDFKIEY